MLFLGKDKLRMLPFKERKKERMVNSLRMSLKADKSPDPAKTTDRDNAHEAMQFSIISSSIPFPTLTFTLRK